MWVCVQVLIQRHGFYGFWKQFYKGVKILIQDMLELRQSDGWGIVGVLCLACGSDGLFALELRSGVWD